MKKLLLCSIFLVLLHLTASAQVLDKGNFIIGSTVGFSTAKSNVSAGEQEEEGLSARQLNIAPNIGYFVVDKLAVGLGADFTLNAVTEPNKDKTEDSDLLFGPFVRYYFPTSDNVAFFLVTNFGFGNSKDNQTTGGVKQNISTNIFAVGAGPGMTVYSKGGFGIETVLKYNYARSNFDTEIAGVKTTTTTRTNQIALSLGLQYYFGGLRRVRG